MVNILYVPLLIDTLGKTEYGIWLILSNILGWLTFFDIGVGNGLRNKFAEAKANGNLILARAYVSTAYAIISIVFISIGIAISSIIPFMNWNKIFNTTDIPGNSLANLAFIVFIFFILRFITQLISVLLLADQRTALSSSLTLISNIIVLIIIFVLNKLKLSTLVLCGGILSCVPVLTFIIASIYLFTHDYAKFKPSINYVNIQYFRPLFSLGIKFLIIQLACIIFYSTTELIITQLYSPNEVTIYNIAYKYFAISSMIYGIIMAQIWSAITESYAKGEYEWIRGTMKKLRAIAYYLTGMVVVMLAASNVAYKIWLGTGINIPFELSAVLAAYFIIYLLFNPYVTFLNGVGKIKLNMIIVVFQTLAYLPTIYLFVKIFKLGLPGIILAIIFCEIPLRITQPYQYKLIINKKAYGIWNE